MKLENIGSNATERQEWQLLLNTIKVNMPCVDIILPIMAVIAQWTQVMSGNTRVSISLVRFIIRGFRKLVNDLSDAVADFLDGQNQKLMLADIAKSFEELQVDTYFGYSVYDHFFYRLAEHLYPRTV